MLTQRLKIHHDLYSIVVESANARHETGMLMGRISKPGKAGPLVESVPGEAAEDFKQRLHQEVYRAAGVRNHICSEHCRRWSQ